MKIVATLRVDEALLSEVRRHDVVYEAYDNIIDAGEALADADVLVTFGEDVTEEILARCSKLKWIMVVSAGLELMPLAAIKKRNILVTNARGIHAIPMAEYVVGMILSYNRKFALIRANEMERRWERDIYVAELHGQTALFLGTGAIAQTMAERLKAFGVTVIGLNTNGRAIEPFDNIVQLAEIATVLPKADFVINALPSTEETYHLLKGEYFEVMKRTAVFINVGRGTIVDEALLMDVMKRGIIAHAILDVFSIEPLAEHHPFWTMDNVTVTPHLSSRSHHYLPRAFAIFAHNLTCFLMGEGEYMNRVQLEKGY